MAGTVLLPIENNTTQMTRNNTTTYREKGRAAFLAVIMVLSVVAMSASFAGAAAAHDTVDYQVDGDTRSLVYQGQTVDAVSPEIVDGEDYELREETSTDGNTIESSSFVEELTADGDTVEIDTDDLDAGDYFIRGPGLSAAAADETFEVTIQDLDVEFDDEVVSDSGSDAFTDLDVDSNRGTYSLNVSAGGDLSDEELYGIFTDDDDYSDAATHDEGLGVVSSGVGPSGDFNVALYDDAEEDADEKVVLVGISDTEAALNFTDIDTDDYEFEFEVIDTEASATASITVGEEDVAADFDQGVYTQTAGDVVEITVDLEDTDETFVQFGDEDAGFVDILYLEDDDDNGEVTFYVNTRLAGTDHTTAGLSADDVYYSEDDIVESYIHHYDLDGTASNVQDAEFHSDDDLDDDLTFGEYLEELDLLSDETDDFTEQIVRPLQPTAYDLVADRNGDFIAEDSESDVDDEIGFATLDLITPGIDGVNTWVGPSEDADDEDEISELVEKLTEREDIALDDQLVIQAQASGIYGHMAALSDNDLNELDEGFDSNVLYTLTEVVEGEGVNFVVEDSDVVGNQEPNELDLQGADDDEVFVLVDNEAGEFYVIVDTDAEPFDRSISDGDHFDVTLEYETDDDDRFRFGGSANTEVFGGADGDTSEAAFPYFAADSTQSVSTSFTFEDAEVTFDNLEDDKVQLEVGEDVVVTGETNVAPGTDSTLRATNTGDTASFLNNADVTIDSDGSFASEEIDFSQRGEGDEATLNYRVSGSSIGTATAIFSDAVEEDDDDAADDEADDDAADDEADDDEADDHDDADDEMVDEDDDDAVEVTDDDDDDDAADDDGTPGFGAAVAAVALLAAAMLALRRQN